MIYSWRSVLWISNDLRYVLRDRLRVLFPGPLYVYIDIGFDGHLHALHLRIIVLPILQIRHRTPRHELECPQVLGIFCIERGIF